LHGEINKNSKGDALILQALPGGRRWNEIATKPSRPRFVAKKFTDSTMGEIAKIADQTGTCDQSQDRQSPLLILRKSLGLRETPWGSLGAPQVLKPLGVLLSFIHTTHVRTTSRAWPFPRTSPGATQHDSVDAYSATRPAAPLQRVNSGLLRGAGGRRFLGALNSEGGGVTGGPAPRGERIRGSANRFRPPVTPGDSLVRFDSASLPP
jgi:hypothetical protein